jgi:putative transposase
LGLRNGDYYVHVTTYQVKTNNPIPHEVLGVGFGVDKQLTLSNGLDIKEAVVPTKKLRRIHRELSRRKRHGANWFKTNLRLNRECNRAANQRRDIKNKIVSDLVSRYETIKVQDDNIRGWTKMWGTRIQASTIGGIMSALEKRGHAPVLVPRYLPTTKLCSRCGNIQDIGLAERVYQCGKCDLFIDRNYNASINILNYGVPAECRELTPVDTRPLPR